MTIATIEKEFCFCEYGSALLTYENGDRFIDIGKSEIEVESKKEYRKWKIAQNKNINPFRTYDEIDLGYLEDMEGWLYSNSEI